jgi:hypothetical protein
MHLANLALPAWFGPVAATEREPSIVQRKP